MLNSALQKYGSCSHNFRNPALGNLTIISVNAQRMWLDNHIFGWKVTETWLKVPSKFSSIVLEKKKKEKEKKAWCLGHLSRLWKILEFWIPFLIEFSSTVTSAWNMLPPDVWLARSLISSGLYSNLSWVISSKIVGRGMSELTHGRYP